RCPLISVSPDQKFYPGVCNLFGGVQQQTQMIYLPDGAGVDDLEHGGILQVRVLHR
ncbi:hypothetical protein LPJCHP_LPJCHP_05975, partial [Dysosmobacter welbionis]